jgi:sulfur relay (sulfurtransferase) DsrF/TusC family protein
MEVSIVNSKFEITTDYLCRLVEIYEDAQTFVCEKDLRIATLKLLDLLINEEKNRIARIRL